MARKSNGWVKIHSKILKAELTPSQFKFFVGSILLANPLTAKDPGLVDLSARQLAKELRMSHIEVWRKEQELSKRDMITILNKGFQINNYAYYQGGASVTHTKQQSPLQSVSPTEQSVTNLVPKQTPKKEEVLRSIKKKKVTPPTTNELKILDILKGLKGWRYDETDDLAWLRDFTKEFPDFNLGQLKLARDYYAGKPVPKHKGAWRKRLRNWMLKKLEFERKEQPGPLGKPFEQYIKEQEEGK